MKTVYATDSCGSKVAQVNESGIPELVSTIEGLRSEADYSAVLDRFGIRRTHGVSGL
jgi:hypothetical protein